MGIEMPTEITYYYECSYGDFRLVYHIPRDIVVKMIDRGEIRKEALQDFPDGIDIKCSSIEYDTFEADYGYRPPLEPRVLERAFRGIFPKLEHEDTWEDFIGSGDIKASELEDFSKSIEDTLKEMKVEVPEEIQFPKKRSIKGMRHVMGKRIKQQAKVEKTLRKISPKIVDESLKRGSRPAGESLRPNMSKGESPETVFSRAQRNVRRE